MFKCLPAIFERPVEMFAALPSPIPLAWPVGLSRCPTPTYLLSLSLDLLSHQRGSAHTVIGPSHYIALCSHSRFIRNCPFSGRCGNTSGGRQVRKQGTRDQLEVAWTNGNSGRAPSSWMLSADHRDQPLRSQETRKRIVLESKAISQPIDAGGQGLLRLVKISPLIVPSTRSFELLGQRRKLANHTVSCFRYTNFVGAG